MGVKPVWWVAILAVTFVGGCARGVDDAALAARIQSQISSDNLLKDADLRVSALRGEVTLSGTVPSEAARRAAFRIASQAPGAKNVNDQMAVVEAAAVATDHSPASISTNTAAQTRSRQREESKRRDSGADEAKSVESAPPAPTIARLRMSYTPITETVQPTPPQMVTTPAQAPLLPALAPGPQSPPLPKDIVVPANTMLTVRMIDTVDSSVNHAGEIFHAALETPLVVDSQTIVPRGADIYVRLASAKIAGRLKGKSELHMELLKLEFQGRSYSLYSSTYTVTGNSKGSSTAKKVGSGAAVGAVIGAIAGAGAGAAIGAGVGAGAGAVWNVMSKGKQVKIPSETRLDFQLEQAVTVTVIPRPTFATK